MNRVRLFAKFEETPSKKKQKLVELELRSVMSDMCSGDRQEVFSGTGCWWMSIFCLVIKPACIWVIDEFASRSFNKGLDRFERRFDKSLGSEMMLPNSQPDSETNKTSRDNEIEKAQEIVKTGSQSSNLTKKTDIINTLGTMLETLGAREVVLSEWSDAEKSGQALCLRENSDTVTVHWHKTDSKEDLDSYIDSYIDRG